MRGVNLIPAPRRQARQRRAIVRRWVTAAAAYAGAMLVLSVAVRLGWDPGDRTLSDQIQRATQRVAELGARLGKLGPQLAQAQSSLETSRMVTQQPDWSILLGWLSNTISEDVVLRECRLTPVSAEKQAGETDAGAVQAVHRNQEQDAPWRGATPPQAFVFHLRGLGGSQQAVSEFVLRLEGSGLFDRVTLIETHREPFLSSTAIAFELRCPLSGKGGGAP